LPSPSIAAPAPALLSSRTPRTGPKLSPRVGPKADTNKDSKGKEMLPSAEALLELASDKMVEVAELEQAAQRVHETSLERQIGAALAALNKPPSEAIRDWQTNPGKMAPIELRQVVRNRLKIRADNKAIDVLFASLDKNHSGVLDATQIQAAVKVFTKAVKDANKEAERLQEAAAIHRAIAEHARVAGEAVALLELRSGAGNESEPETACSLQRLVVRAVLQGGLSYDRLLAMWDTDHKGTMTSTQLAQAVRAIRVQATDVEVAEFHSELTMTTNAAAGAPLSTKLVVRHLVDLAKAEGVRSKEYQSSLKGIRKEARRLVRELEEAKVRPKVMAKVELPEAPKLPEPPTGGMVVELAAAPQALSIAAGKNTEVRTSGGSATSSPHSSPLSSPLASPGGAVPCSARKPRTATPRQQAVDLWPAVGLW